MRNLFLGVWAVLQLGCGTGGEQQGEVVAKVGEVRILAQDLLRFKDETPALLRSEKTGVDELEDYLGSMVDMELMLLEARSRGLDQTPEQLEKWEGERKRKLIAVFLQKHIQEKLNLSPEELQRRYKESKWSRMLKLAHIRVKTEEEGRQVVADLAGGRAFEELARERSVYQKDAGQGGLLKPYFGRGNIDELGLPLEIAEQVFELKVGEYGGPYSFSGGYEVFKVVDERPAPSSYAMVFAQTTFLEAFNTERQKVWEGLRKDFEVQPDQDGLRFFLQMAATAKGDSLRLDDQDRERVLCRYKGGQVTVGDLASAYRLIPSPRQVSFDSSTVSRFIEEHLLPEALIYRRALDEGLEQDSTVAAWITGRKKSLLVEALKEEEVEKRIDLGEAALRQYYQAHQERFMLPAETQLVEILSKTEAEARDLRQRIPRGEDMSLLAEKHSIRPGVAKAKGVFHMHPFERQRNLELYDAAEKAEIGKLQGPVQTAEGYTVFRVLARLPARPQPFEQASTKVKYWLGQEEGKRLFEAMLSRLREQYAAEIVVYKDRLSKMANGEAGT